MTGSLLRLPRARWQFATGLLAQVTQGAMGVGIILVVRRQTGSLALAGGVVGALSVAAGVARPIQGRLLDRRGSRVVLAGCGAGHALALIGIVLGAQAHVPGAVLVALGCGAGAMLPPVSTAMRLEYARLVGDADRTRAYSLVYLAQELGILTGPLILAAMVAAASASAALIVVAAVAAAGTFGFAAGTAPDAAVKRQAVAHTRSVLRIPAMRVMMATILLLGAALGGLEVGAPTLATAHGTPAAAGLLIACLSVGGVIGAALYGTRQWRAEPGRRLLVLVALLTVMLAPIFAIHDLVAVGALLLVAGIALNPALTTFSLIVDKHVDARTAGEAFGWISTAISSGQGGASALAAAVAQHQHDPRPAFVIAAVAAAIATGVCVAARRVLA